MNGLGIIGTLPILSTDPSAGFVIMFEEPTIWSILLHILTVLILFYVLGKLLFNPVREILEKRKQEIADEYQRIEDDTQAVATLKTEYEDKLKNINAEADQILTHARKRAIEREDEIVANAKEEADRILKRAKLDIAREREQMQDGVRREIIEVATVMASKFVAATINEELKSQLVEETMTSMSESTWQE